MSTPRTILEQPEAWAHLQAWFDRNDDPLRPWNVSAISRKVKMPQAVVRSLLTAQKGAAGMSRTAFTVERLRIFQKLFRKYDYRPNVPEEVDESAGTCRPFLAPQSVTMQPIAYLGH